MDPKNILTIQKQYIIPIEIAFWIGIIGIPLLAWHVTAPGGDRPIILVIALISILVSLVLFRWLVPRFGFRPWIQYLGSIWAIYLISHGALLYGPYQINLEAIYAAVIASNGIMAGKKTAWHVTLLCGIAEFSVTFLSLPFSKNSLLISGINILIILLSGYLISSLSGLLYERLLVADKRNRYLSALLQIGTITTKLDELNNKLLNMAEIIAKDVPVTTCIIYLLDSQGKHLITHSGYPIRHLKSWRLEIGKRFAGDDLPNLETLFREGSPIIIRNDQAEFIPEETRRELFSEDVKTICMIPLLTQGKKLGILVLGEARSLEREPFSQEKLNLLQTLATQISSAIHNNQLYNALHDQAQRLAVLNEVAQAIGSTIELDNLLELIYEQLKKVIPADTYFVSLYDPIEKAQELRIVIDAGVRYPKEKIPLGQGLSSWVIENKRPLLIHHMDKEFEKLPLKPITLGQDKLSQSWLGAPMLIGEQILGLIAIASYIPYSFTEDDVTLLLNLASQAALALDNARQHANVKEQAQRDSLTGAYNHGRFLAILNDNITKGAEQNNSISLIMIDIDDFKIYNDTYGHVIGDQVLIQVVKALQSSVPPNSAVGRWGGEEFAVALPNITTEEAFKIAKAIRQAIAELSVYGKNQTLLPNPTMSQGIASYPEHASDAAELVDIADRALYDAKGQGGNRIVVFSK